MEKQKKKKNLKYLLNSKVLGTDIWLKLSSLIIANKNKKIMEKNHKLSKYYRRFVNLYKHNNKDKFLIIKY